MDFVCIPLKYGQDEASGCLERETDDRVRMIDKLIELIVFTPRGSFAADPDFGFEYWNYEYSNIHYRDFNDGYFGMSRAGLYNVSTKKACQDSIRISLETYESRLKHIDVAVALNAVGIRRPRGRKPVSKYEVSVKVSGVLDDGLGTVIPYEKQVQFYMEPTVRPINV